MNDKEKTAILFVCMGNICRSPTAHGVMRQKVQDHNLSHLVFIESAGTHAYHVGEAPDTRSTALAAQRGVDLSDLRALRIEAHHFYEYDYILAMDRQNLSILEQLKPEGSSASLDLLMAYAEGGEVPDPYYGGERGFVNVFEMIERACDGLLESLDIK